MSVALPLEPSICITNEELTLQADEYQRQLVGSHRQCSAVTVYIWYPWCQTRKDEKTLPRGSHIPLLCHCRHLLWNIPTRHKKALVIRFTNALNSESGLFKVYSLFIYTYIHTRICIYTYSLHLQQPWLKLLFQIWYHSVIKFWMRQPVWWCGAYTGLQKTTCIACQ